MAAREAPPLVVRLLNALRPELDAAADKVLDEVDAAIGEEPLERARAAGVAVAKLVDLMKARRTARGTGGTDPGRR